MPKGPAGINRPFVKTRLKYDIEVFIPDWVTSEDPKATEVLDKRITTPQDTVIENVQDQIGDVILATQNLAHPNRTEVIDAEFKEEKSNGDIITWTYVIKGKGGVGQAAEANVFMSHVADMQRVLVDEDSTPIKRNTKIRKFDPGPLDVRRGNITTQ